MWVSLVSVALGSIVTLLLYFGLNYLLPEQQFFSARAVINSMNLFAPFLCLGLDNAAPRLVQKGSNGSYVWGFLVYAIIGALALVLLGWAVGQWKYSPFIIGAGFALTLSTTLVASNYLRAQGAHRRYFLNVNIYDRFARTFILLGAAVFFEEFLFWALVVVPAFIIYSASVVVRSGATLQGSLRFPTEEARRSLPLILSSVAIILLTRSPYFAAYIKDGVISANATDLILLFSLLILLPVLNVQKIDEVILKGSEAGGRPNNGRQLALAEFVIISGFISFLLLANIMGFLSRADLIGIAMPLGIGMILISMIPNFPHILLLVGRTKAGLAVTVIATVLATLSYTVVSALTDTTAWGFVFAALAYTLTGVVFARQYIIPYVSAGRITRTVALAAYLVVALNCAALFDLPDFFEPLVSKVNLVINR